MSPKSIWDDDPAPAPAPVEFTLDDIVSSIVTHSGCPEADVRKRIDAKIVANNGLLTAYGAADIIAKDNGIAIVKKPAPVPAATAPVPAPALTCPKCHAMLKAPPFKSTAGFDNYRCGDHVTTVDTTTGRIFVEDTTYPVPAAVAQPAPATTPTPSPGTDHGTGGSVTSNGTAKGAAEQPAVELDPVVNAVIAGTTLDRLAPIIRRVEENMLFFASIAKRIEAIEATTAMTKKIVESIMQQPVLDAVTTESSLQILNAKLDKIQADLDAEKLGKQLDGGHVPGQVPSDVTCTAMPVAQAGAPIGNQPMCVGTVGFISTQPSLAGIIPGNVPAARPVTAADVIAAGIAGIETIEHPVKVPAQAEMKIVAKKKKGDET